MNTVDIILIFILIGAFVIGFKNGFVKTSMSLFSWIVGIYAAVFYAGRMAIIIKRWISSNDDLVRILSYVIVFLLVVLLFNLLGRLFTGALNVMMMGPLNQIAGGIFNVIKYLVIVSFVIMLINSGNTYRMLSESQRESSWFYEPVASIAPAIFPAIRTNLQNFDTDWIPDFNELPEKESDTVVQDSIPLKDENFEAI